MKEIDYDELSFKQLLKYAEKGDEWAQYLVGLEYAFPENDEEADEEEAVIEQDPEAAYDLALKVAEEAANRNVGPALLKLGRMYFDGEGTPKKYTSARIFLERAWEFGQDQAEAAIRVLKH